MGTLSGMTLDASIFKAYDVRGIVPDQFDPDGAYRIARAYVEVFRAKRIAIGHDMRLSSPALAEAAVSPCSGRLARRCCTSPSPTADLTAA